MNEQRLRISRRGLPVFTLVKFVKRRKLKHRDDCKWWKESKIVDEIWTIAWLAILVIVISQFFNSFVTSYILVIVLEERLFFLFKHSYYLTHRKVYIRRKLATLDH